MSPVEFVLKAVSDKLAMWKRIRAACDGEDAVKALREEVLPKPNADDTSEQNAARYAAYLKRAVWYNVAARTLKGLVGYVFAKDPVVELPATLKALEDNVDGSGVTLDQQAKAALTRVLQFGRAGLLVDYPSTGNVTTQKDLLDGNIAPTIVLYDPEAITNWRYRVQGAKSVLELLVLRECYTVPDASNEFSLVEKIRYRVLTLDETGVHGRIFVQAADKSEFEEDATQRYDVRNKSGAPFKEIPFTFLGAENNDATVDLPPILDLVTLNFAHFRNSADYEEACYMVGQPTPYVSGLTESWVKDVLKGTMHLGSRAIIPLPQGGSAGLLQAAANTMQKEAMDAKERQMVALGAKLVEQKDVQRTATEAGLEHASEVSTLTAAASNVFLAYKTALGFCGEFVGATDAKIEFDLSEPLASEVVTPEQATAITAMWQGGLIDFEEARHALKRSGIAWKDDNEVKENVQADAFDDAAALGQPPATKPPPAKKQTGKQVAPPPADA